MSIEVTSITPDERRFSLRNIAAAVRNYLPDSPLTNKQLVFRFALVLIAIAAITGTDALLASYKYYSRIIDARLASGYLTSRPGLYAAPRTLQRGDTKQTRSYSSVTPRRLRRFARKQCLERQLSGNELHH